MHATPENIELLCKLQDTDRQRLRAQLALDELPHPAKIAALKEKRASVEAKREKIEALRQREEATLESLSAEDEHLSERSKEIQARIEELKGDYRSVTSLTRDLEGNVKRRETLEFEMQKIVKKIDEIDALANQAGKAIAQISAQENQLSAIYTQKAVELERIISQAQDARASLESGLPADLAALYNTTAARCGGIAIAHLQEGTCDVCRNAIEPNRLLKIKREAPISECPNCRRMLIVE